MKIFGVSLMTIAFLALAFYLGAKNPGVVAKLPIVGS